MRILVMGINHRTAPVELRERVAFDPEQARRAAAELTRPTHQDRPLLREAAVLSTCNRSELYAVPDPDATETVPALRDYFAAFHGLSPVALASSLYVHEDADAVRHLFRVAAGLDSMLLGEAEILGQVRTAYQRAFANGTTGPVLNRMFQGALEAGRRVRSQTGLGAGPMSVAFAAVKLAEQIFGRLRECTALIVGAGTVGEQLVEHLRNRKIRNLLVANRSWERACALAARFHGEAVRWDELSQIWSRPDIVVTSLAVREPWLTRAELETAMAARGNRPLFVIDLGVPRNVEAEVGTLYNVYLYNLDSLAEIVKQNRRARQQEIPRAEQIVEEHVARFEAWRAAAEMVELLRSLRHQGTAPDAAALDQRLERMHDLSPQERRDLRGIAEELLALARLEPEAQLRHMPALRERVRRMDRVRDLLGITKGTV
ncbi:MAG: glutamyl-tRNA reductase [Firmicutes bacterium]|nr:glutamyl-tRNA reductase [Bacillota bacterium]